MKKETSKYWVYGIDRKWYEKDFPRNHSLDDLSEFLENTGYFLEPDMTLGDEFDKIEMYEHPHQDNYLFYIVLDDFRKVVFAESLPSMFFVLEQVNYLINGRLRTIKILESMNED